MRSDSSFSDSIRLIPRSSVSGRTFPEIASARVAAYIALGLSGMGVFVPLFAAPAGEQGAAKVQAGDTTPPKTYTYEVIATYPHDRDAFTQGLVCSGKSFFETTGLNGHSVFREVEIPTGKVLRETKLDEKYFGEGMTVLGAKAYQVTWRHGRGFVYDLATLKPEHEFSYEGEGWGLTTDGTFLILSDGTENLRFIDPKTFQIIRTISVTNRGEPVQNLNELEYIKGEIYANVWQTNWVVRIDPKTGVLVGVINLSKLLAPSDYQSETDVLNGIAYDAASDRLFVTGKKWPKVFEIRLREIEKD